MDNILNEMYNCLLNSGSLNLERFNTQLANCRDIFNPNADQAQVRILLAGRTSIETLSERIQTRLAELQIQSASFVALQGMIDRYYEEHEPE